MEFKLSDKRKSGYGYDSLKDEGRDFHNYEEDDVKEFIRLLKKKVCIDDSNDCRVNLCETRGGKDCWICRNCAEIDKLAGDELVWDLEMKL